MPAARRQSVMPRRNILRNGTILAVSEAAKLVNIPLAQDVASHIRKMAMALKPSVLQAPKDNDMSARELALCVKGLVDTLNTAFEYMERVGFCNMDDEVASYLIELQALKGRLLQVYSELQAVQKSQYGIKLASQSQIRDRIIEIKEELWQDTLRVSTFLNAPSDSTLY
ncbi:unnamed protein product [Rhizoctonia solani]|uniref:Uncharacterized protein n=1 Tax=Rhizoctonia solani TaxID=456999 RepID=A0A8H3E4K0_9AGAM|nr:unnamed protein product [Rhizoctonia solani]